MSDELKQCWETIEEYIGDTENWELADDSTPAPPIEAIRKVSKFIAAAPDLLEALKDLLDTHLDEWGVDKSTVRAHAAIAKAEGKS